MTFKHVVCANCGAKNRIPVEKLSSNPVCGKCKEPLFIGEPISLTADNFAHLVTETDIPVVVDFWASWCGPCQMMAPEFSKACATLEPNYRLAKLNTEQAQQIAAQYNIRSIPCVILFKNGIEVARQAGVMRSVDLIKWVTSH